MEYLGYVIGEGLIRPQVSKVQAIQSYPVPTTKRKVKSFIGLVGWYRKFIPRFSDRSVVLTNLTKHSAPTRDWTKDCDKALRDLKDAICKDPVLHCPSFSEPVTLQTDAS